MNVKIDGNIPICFRYPLSIVIMNASLGERSLTLGTPPPVSQAQPLRNQHNTSRCGFSLRHSCFWSLFGCSSSLHPSGVQPVFLQLRRESLAKPLASSPDTPNSPASFSESLQALPPTQEAHKAELIAPLRLEAIYDSVSARSR